jgi:DNA-binding NtrC family response regulator
VGEHAGLPRLPLLGGVLVGHEIIRHVAKRVHTSISLLIHGETGHPDTTLAKASS